MRLATLALGAWLGLALPAGAEEQPQPRDSVNAHIWFERMATALNQEQFQLSLIQLQREQIRSLRYLHGQVDGRWVAFLDHLNGPLKSAVRIDNTVTYLEHDATPYSVQSSRIPGWLPSIFAQDHSRLLPHYKLALAGRSRVAGHTAQLIRVVPEDELRYQYRVWLDVESALPLRVDLIDHDHNLLEQMLVVELRTFNTASSFLTELSAQTWPEAMLPSHVDEQPQWQFGWLPSGFELTHYNRHMLVGLAQPVEHLALSDGLAELSVYIGRASDVELPSHLTTTNGLALASATYGELEVVVVGKLPVNTLNNIANNIYPQRISRSTQ